MPWAAVAMGAGSLIGGALGSSSAKKAAREQARTQRAAIQLQRDMYENTRSDLAPYREGGGTAVSPLVSLVTDPRAAADYVQTNPMYHAAASQASDELMANQAAKGMLGSGYTAGALQQKYLALGDQFLNSQVNRLSNLAHMGQSAAAGTASANQSAGNALSDLIQGQGNIAAAGQIGQANAWGNALNGVAQAGGSYLQGYKTRQPEFDVNATMPYSGR